MVAILLGTCLPGQLWEISVYQKGSKFNLVARDCPVHERIFRSLLNKTNRSPENMCLELV